MRQYDRAIEQLQKALELDKHSTVAQMYLGYYYALSGKFDVHKTLNTLVQLMHWQAKPAKHRRFSKNCRKLLRNLMCQGFVLRLYTRVLEK